MTYRLGRDCGAGAEGYCLILNEPTFDYEQELLFQLKMDSPSRFVDLLFSIENGEEVKEIDNYDRLIDALSEFCFILGDFEEDENESRFFDTIQKDEEPVTANKGNWYRFDMNILKTRILPV